MADLKRTLETLENQLTEGDRKGMVNLQASAIYPPEDGDAVLRLVLLRKSPKGKLLTKSFRITVGLKDILERTSEWSAWITKSEDGERQGVLLTWDTYGREPTEQMGTAPAVEKGKM